jgi:hypothetical protein
MYLENMYILKYGFVCSLKGWYQNNIKIIPVNFDWKHIYFPIHPPNIFLSAFPENTQWMRLYFWPDQIHLPCFLKKEEVYLSKAQIQRLWRLTFVCLYGYNTDEPSLFNIILQKVLTFSNTSILLCGDWNVVLDKYMNTYNIIHNKNPILPIFFYLRFLKTHNGCVFTFGPIKYICPVF